MRIARLFAAGDDERLRMLAASDPVDGGPVSAIMYHRPAVELALDLQRWDLAEHQAKIFERDGGACQFTTYAVRRARALLAYGRGDRSDGIDNELVALRAEARSVGFGWPEPRDA